MRGMQRFDRGREGQHIAGRQAARQYQTFWSGNRAVRTSQASRYDIPGAPATQGTLAVNGAGVHLHAHMALTA